MIQAMEPMTQEEYQTPPVEEIRFGQGIAQVAQMLMKGEEDFISGYKIPYSEMSTLNNRLISGTTQLGLENGDHDIPGLDQSQDIHEEISTQLEGDMSGIHDDDVMDNSDFSEGMFGLFDTTPNYSAVIPMYQGVGTPIKGDEQSDPFRAPKEMSSGSKNTEEKQELDPFLQIPENNGKKGDEEDDNTPPKHPVTPSMPLPQCTWSAHYEGRRLYYHLTGLNCDFSKLPDLRDHIDESSNQQIFFHLDKMEGFLEEYIWSQVVEDMIATDQRDLSSEQLRAFYNQLHLVQDFLRGAYTQQVVDRMKPMELLNCSMDQLITSVIDHSNVNMQAFLEQKEIYDRLVISHKIKWVHDLFQYPSRKDLNDAIFTSKMMTEGALLVKSAKDSFAIMHDVNNQLEYFKDIILNQNAIIEDLKRMQDSQNQNFAKFMVEASKFDANIKALKMKNLGPLTGDYVAPIVPAPSNIVSTLSGSYQAMIKVYSKVHQLDKMPETEIIKKVSDNIEKATRMIDQYLNRTNWTRAEKAILAHMYLTQDPSLLSDPEIKAMNDKRLGVIDFFKGMETKIARSIEQDEACYARPGVVQHQIPPTIQPNITPSQINFASNQEEYVYI